MERVQADRQQQFSRTMPDGTTVSSYVELYEAKLKQQDHAIKELRERSGAVIEVAMDDDGLLAAPRRLGREVETVERDADAERGADT